MSHARQIIREAVATILAATPVAWESVTESRIASTLQIWPYLMVFSESEQSDPSTVNNPCIYDRRMTLTVAGMLRLPGSGDTYTIEDEMDAIASEIETKLTQTALRAIVQIHSMYLKNTSMDVVIEENGIDHAEIIMSYEINYATLEGVPSSLI